MDVLVIAADVACWGAVVVIWVVLGLYEAGTRRVERVRGRTDIGLTLSAAIAVVAIVLIGRVIFAPFTVEAGWVRVIGAGTLVGSTVFAIWARLALGSSWSVGPEAAIEQGLRTDGPYAITRHPIYTGLLGMLLGSSLSGGLGQAIVLIPVGLVIAWLKVKAEERLLLATFPDAYVAYRDRVPALIPGWGSWFGRRRRAR